jgi:hypothetical protein
MFKELIILTLSAASLTAATAQNSLKITSVDQLATGRQNVKVEATAEPQVFRVNGASSLYSKDSIAIDPAKRYRLSGKFRNATPDKALRISFGVNGMDERKRPISGGSVDAVPGTETELAADFKGGDTVLKVKDASEWKKGRIPVFKVDASGKLADLPNLNTEYITIKDIAINADNQYDVTMSSPLKQSYPAGTSVRQHESGQWFHFPALNVPLSGDWQEFEFVFNGESASGSESGKWRKNTKSAGIAAYINPGQVKDGVTELKDLGLEEVQ